ncbi:carboxymuconolactone decarboxylase family protein [Vreelandella sp. EE27]
MKTRLSQQAVYTLNPRIPKHLAALANTSSDSAVTPMIVHLVELRVSQLNQCCFCQHKHAEQARESGEHQGRLDVLPGWREAPCFNVQERAALAWAEALTLVNRQRVDDATYQQALDAFGERDLMELTAVILAMNSWNRVAISMQFVPDMTASL